MTKVLVTGGASGLGEAITRTLVSRADTFVYFTYNKSADNAKTLESSFANCSAIHCDFSDLSDVDALCQSIEALDIRALVNNATTGFEVNHFHKLKSKYFVDNFTLNVLPTIMITQASIKFFRKVKFGKIITVLSSAIIDKPPVGWSEYTAAKAYLGSLSKSWSTENSAFNITSNCISPAFMQTPLTAATDERMIADMITKHPLKSLLGVQEVAEAVAFFLDATQHINGTNLIINAGQHVI
jgi:NAD(P)-dependent dehydrogenase (short-subunit alcohol dehydrogenase family)